MRRDVSSFLNAVMAYAVLHKAQRETERDGAIVATLDDYSAAHEAFDEGLAGAHGKASEKVIATVEAIEKMQDETDETGLAVKVTLREFAKRLRVASQVTAGARLMAAVDYGAIEQVDALSGRGGARYFKILKTPQQIREEPGLGVFPPRADVEYYFLSREGPNQLNKRNKNRKKRKKALKRSGYERGFVRYERALLDWPPGGFGRGSSGGGQGDPRRRQVAPRSV